MFGDSKTVVGILNREFYVNDAYLFNSSQLFFDTVGHWSSRIRWISRNDNVVCDMLARQAAGSGISSVSGVEGEIKIKVMDIVS